MLIEVALPLEEINRESAREKSIRHGHPSTLHLWWARRPLAACRAVLFASLVEDPGSDPAYAGDPGGALERRAALLDLLGRLVRWESTNDARVIREARAEIAASAARRKIALGVLCDSEEIVGADGDRGTVGAIAARRAPASAVDRFLADHGPPVLDPFAGGGSIPLEAQRLGLRVHASDLNPVAVLINRALVEIPRQYAGRPPARPEPGSRPDAKTSPGSYRGAQGLAADVRHYGQWMREQALERIGHLYPPLRITPALARSRPDAGWVAGDQVEVVAWLWARTVASPHPAAGGAHVPLVTSFRLSDRRGGEAYLEPILDRKRSRYRFVVRPGRPAPGSRGAAAVHAGTKVGRGPRFRCLLTGEPIPEAWVKAEGRAGRLGARLMAQVAVDAHGRRHFLDPDPGQERRALGVPKPPDLRGLDAPLVHDRRALWCVLYGLDTFDKLFTARQLTALMTFSGLVQEAREQVLRDLPERDPARADAVATYLAFACDKCADYWTSIATWMPRGTVGHALNKQAVPMTWDYPEANPFARFHCAWQEAVEWVAKSVAALGHFGPRGVCSQQDAVTVAAPPTPPVMSTDPPYYDNIGYADLSDFFYVWLRLSLRDTYPELFTTLVAPKAQEIVATPHRHHGSKPRAKAFFETRLAGALRRARTVTDPDLPLTIYYAFKQAESTVRQGTAEVASTGWEPMLSGVIEAGFTISGTWPIRTERGARSIGLGTNALASSIVLVCRPRPDPAPTATRREFIATLRAELPEAIRDLTQGSSAPVDLAQAAIGPGMAVYSRFRRVLDPDGSPLSVRTALALINRELDETLAAQESDLDADTRWAVEWYAQYAHRPGPFGEALTLATAKGVAVDGLQATGIVATGRGQVRLRDRRELGEDGRPAAGPGTTIWEITQHLIRGLVDRGDAAAGRLVRALETRCPTRVDAARELAYRLHAIAERNGWAEEARGYNALVAAWPEITRDPREREGRRE